ncbi:MAG: helix-hairpin-helix domain-containing protein [Chloroflexales bacterium]|nr:helix-hairpin-helix domain-containing protein [Chloroflexales bacterium]
MNGDFSRLPPTPPNMRGYLWQQGRVNLESDLNGLVLNDQRVGDRTRRDMIGSCGAPEADPGFAVTPTDAGDTLRIGPGQYYVDGIPCENPGAVLITEQPGLPGFELPGEEGYYLAYLDIWERHTTALEDPALREVALGGPDTCVRQDTVCQVRLALIEPDPTATPPSCEQFDGWRPPAFSGAASRLRARSTPTPEQEEPCIVPARAGYRGLENLLYRVELHTGSDSEGGPIIKWARDNASIVAALVGIDGRQVSISHPARDVALAFAPGQWIELKDERRMLRREAGVLARLAAVDGAVLTVEAWDNDQPPELGPGAFVQRWDAQEALVGPDQEEWVALEGGVEVQLIAEGGFRSGDYWQIPARTATGDVEWPHDAGGEPLAVPRHGVEHHFCALAILIFEGGQWELISDCRRRFPSLSDLPDAGADGPGLHITAVLRRSNGAVLPNDTAISVASFSQGIRVICDGNIAEASIESPTAYVELELPEPLGVDRSMWGLTSGTDIFGYRRVVLRAAVTAEGATIDWQPTEPTRRWLLVQLFDVVRPFLTDDRPGILGRLTLKGHAISAAGLRERWLDGDVFGLPSAATGRIDQILPSGDGRRGGDFERWFLIVEGGGLDGDSDTLTARLNINTASERELMSLPGIDLRAARRLIRFRPIRDSEDLQRVPGLSASIQSMLRRRAAF